MSTVFMYEFCTFRLNFVNGIHACKMYRRSNDLYKWDKCMITALPFSSAEPYNVVMHKSSVECNLG